MIDQAIGRLRRRMIEDMAIRKLAPKTQHDYVQRVKDFAAFLGHSPDTAKSEEVRGFRLHLASRTRAALTNPSDPASFRDPISHACYPAQIKFLQSLPQVQVIKAKVPFNAIVLFQRERDLVTQLPAGNGPMSRRSWRRDRRRSRSRRLAICCRSSR